jgi:general stress protein 26
LQRWFPKGIDTDGLVMIHVHADRIHYWDSNDEGEISI